METWKLALAWGAHPSIFSHVSFPPRCLREEAWKVGGGWMVKDYMWVLCYGWGQPDGFWNRGAPPL